MHLIRLQTMLIFIYFTQSARYIQHTASSWLVVAEIKKPRPQDGQGQCHQPVIGI